MSLSSPFSTAGTPGLLALAAAGLLALGAGPAMADDAPVEGTTPVVAASMESATPVAAPSVESAPLPAPAPQVPLATSTPDLFAPSVEVGDVRRQLEVARRNGLRVTYTVSEPVVLRADAMIFGDVGDRELRMSALPGAGPGDSLAKATISRTPTGTNVVRLAFNTAARRTLRKFFKVTVLVRLIATDGAGNETTAYKRVSLTND